MLARSLSLRSFMYMLLSGFYVLWLRTHMYYDDDDDDVLTLYTGTKGIYT